MPCHVHPHVSLCVDKLFSLLPLLILSHHILGTTRGSPRTAVLNCALSYAIKIIVRKQRRRKPYRFIPWRFQGLESLKPSYGFPSTHAIFYAGYFFDTPTIYTFTLMLTGSYSRVVYQHHTLWEVHSSIVLALLSKVLRSWIQGFSSWYDD